ncbi:hypothetical protein ACFL6K_03980 [Candidatus Latescibacterota bacterium]
MPLNVRKSQKDSKPLRTLDVLNPDMDWCDSIYKKRGLKTVHCPYVSYDLCPRYYLSCKELKQVSESDIKYYDSYWPTKRIPWNKVKRVKPAVIDNHPDDDSWEGKHYHNFCPEVLLGKFKLSASQIGEWELQYQYEENYRFEIDGEIKEEYDRGSWLSNRDVPENHWMSRYKKVIELHYSDCELYAMLSDTPLDTKHDDSINTQPRTDKQEKTDSEPEVNSNFKPSPGYNTITYKGTKYQIGDRPAAIIRILYENYPNELKEKEINDLLPDKLKSLAERKRIVNCFRQRDEKTRKNGFHPLWKTLVVTGSKNGYFKLNLD